MSQNCYEHLSRYHTWEFIVTWYLHIVHLLVPAKPKLLTFLRHSRVIDMQTDEDDILSKCPSVQKLFSLTLSIAIIQAAQT